MLYLKKQACQAQYKFKTQLIIGYCTRAVSVIFFLPLVLSQGGHHPLVIKIYFHFEAIYMYLQSQCSGIVLDFKSEESSTNLGWGSSFFSSFIWPKLHFQASKNLQNGRPHLLQQQYLPQSEKIIKQQKYLMKIFWPSRDFNPAL